MVSILVLKVNFGWVYHILQTQNDRTENVSQQSQEQKDLTLLMMLESEVAKRHNLAKKQQILK